jgi:hypothetical protein
MMRSRFALLSHAKAWGTQGLYGYPIERTHSGMNRFRRLLIRWEKPANTYIAMLHLACGLLTWRATGLLK